MTAPPRHPFEEPWQAQVFAMTVALQQGGVLGADEWARALGARVDAAGRPDGTDHWECWAAALADLLADRGLVSAADLEATTSAWQAAAARTPHGRPIELEEA